MGRYIFIFILSIVALSCDDGDIFSVELDFDKTLQLCDNDESSYLIYDTRNDPNESLTLIFPKADTSDAFFTTATETDVPVVLSINANTVRFNYRTYNRAVGAGELCAIIPPSDLVILKDYEAPDGEVEVSVTVVDDDNDGIPSADEDLNGNGNYDDDDWDGDGIPNYIDEDDDNDNVKTIDEDNDDDGDGNPFTNPLNTDADTGDTLPNYLDIDDDGDGVLTRLEDQDCDNNPRNDVVANPDGTLGTPFYLDNSVVEKFDCTSFISNGFTRTVVTYFLVRNVNLGPINSTEIELGTFKSVYKIDN